MTVKSAILLVGGMGTRMQPLTFATPKPMLKVAGIPFTEHQIVKAQEAGIEEIVLATSYMSEIFKPYFGNGERLGIKISYAVEESALGTGGAIRNAAEMLTGNGPVMIFNGDVMSSHSLEEQMQCHSSHNADVTLYLTRVPDARAFGSVELDSDDRILTFNEKMENPPTNIINAGCYIFNREIFNIIPLNTVVSVERETFPQLLNDGGKLFGFVEFENSEACAKAIEYMNDGQIDGQNVIVEVVAAVVQWCGCFASPQKHEASRHMAGKDAEIFATHELGAVGIYTIVADHADSGLDCHCRAVIVVVRRLEFVRVLDMTCCTVCGADTRDQFAHPAFDCCLNLWVERASVTSDDDF